MQAPDPQTLINQLTDARQHTCALIEQLTDEQLMGPRLPTVNPLRWEIGHTAYFYEYWVLRQHYKQPPILANIDQLFDSIHIPHDARWDLPLPSLQQTFDYMQQVTNDVIEYLSNGIHDSQRDYLVQYAIFHEDMHCEAFTYTRQTLAYPAPMATERVSPPSQTEHISGDAVIPAGYFRLGSEKSAGFVFDNEKWAHRQYCPSFKISRLAVSNEEYLQFVDDDGYQRPEFWCQQGWEWLTKQSLQHPVYWRRYDDQGRWQVRWFDQWVDMQLTVAVVNVNWYEASAYCRWARRRLPTELEWEIAAAAQPDMDGQSLSAVKRTFPWGHAPHEDPRANFNGLTLGPVDVNARPAGDSAFGCRQMLGNVWEWTSTTFAPYPGFEPDMYQDYSQPLFGQTKVLRGGCFATRSRLLRNTLRNYFGAERNDVFAGFRTCAVE